MTTSVQEPPTRFAEHPVFREWISRCRSFSTEIEAQHLGRQDINKLRHLYTNCDLLYSRIEIEVSHPDHRVIAYAAVKWQTAFLVAEQLRKRAAELAIANRMLSNNYNNLQVFKKTSQQELDNYKQQLSTKDFEIARLESEMERLREKLKEFSTTPNADLVNGVGAADQILQQGQGMLERLRQDLSASFDELKKYKKERDRAVAKNSHTSRMLRKLVKDSPTLSKVGIVEGFIAIFEDLGWRTDDLHSVVSRLREEKTVEIVRLKKTSV